MTLSTSLKTKINHSKHWQIASSGMPDFVHLPLINNGCDLQRFEACVGNLATLLGESSDGTDICEENDFRGVPESFAVNIRKAFQPEWQTIPKGLSASSKIKALAQMILKNEPEANEASA